MARLFAPPAAGRRSIKQLSLQAWATGSSSHDVGAQVCPGTQVCLQGSPWPALFRCTLSCIFFQCVLGLQELQAVLPAQR